MKVTISMELNDGDRTLIASYFHQTPRLASMKECQHWMEGCIAKELDNLPENFSGADEENQ